MDFANSTQLDSIRLHTLFIRHTLPYRHDRLQVRVRYSRSAAFSGRCFYREGRIFINLGRRNRYPFTLQTHAARARTWGRAWRREPCLLTVQDAYQLALFVYLHELYHYLVFAARRHPRRKEAMCDRFAVRVLVDRYDCPLLDRARRLVARSLWDFQNLDGFVAAAPQEPQTLFDLAYASLDAQAPPRRKRASSAS